MSDPDRAFNSSSSRQRRELVTQWQAAGLGLDSSQVGEAAKRACKVLGTCSERRFVEAANSFDRSRLIVSLALRVAARVEGTARVDMVVPVPKVFRGSTTLAESRLLDLAGTITAIELLLYHPAWSLGRKIPNQAADVDSISINAFAYRTAREWTALLMSSPPLAEISLTLSTDGVLATEHHAVPFEGFQFDLARARAAVVAVDRYEPSISSVLPELRTAIVEPDRLPARWIELEGAMRSEWGFGVRALLLLLLALPSYVENTKGVNVVEERSLFETFEQLAAGYRIEVDELREAFAALTLRPDVGVPYEPEFVRAVSQRLVTRPYIPLPSFQDARNGVLIVPYLLARAAEVFLQVLGEGRLPWPGSVPPQVQTALSHIRGERTTRKFEEHVRGEFTRLGWPCLRVPVGLLSSDELPGEVDCVAIDATRGVVWVVEVKDITDAYSFFETMSRLRDFTKMPKAPLGHASDFKYMGFFGKLAAKRDAVEANLDRVLNLLRPQLLEEPHVRQVRGLFVTREPIMAMFLDPPPFPIVTARQIPDLVSSG